MYAEERQQAILSSLADVGRLSVSQLAADYTVTTETVRRDLAVLERAGLVRRVHGGVVRADSFSVLESAVGDRDSAQADEKDRIAQAALALLPAEHGSVLLDAGTTTSRLAAMIAGAHALSVTTHSVPVAARLAGSATVDLHLLPGRVRATTQAAVGADTVAAIDLLRVDVAFLGTNGLTSEHGLSTPDSAEAAVKRAMVGSAKRVVVLADSSKLGQEHPVRFATLDQVDVLVTDAEISRAEQRRLSRMKIEVVVA